MEIWSDVVCPWCAIGKRRFEAALAAYGRRDEVEVVYRSFELDPTAPVRGSETVLDALRRKYGGGREGARRMVEGVVPVAAEVGWRFDFADAPHVATRTAHRLLHLALAEHGPAAQSRLNDGLLSAYFEHARDLGDPEVLRGVADSAGLDMARVDAVLGSEEYDDAVAADLDTARRLGITGVPFFVLDRRLAVSGAQPPEVFAQALAQAGEARAEVGT